MFWLVNLYSLIVLDSVSKNIQISNFMKTRPVGTELFEAGGRAGGGTEGRTRMTRLMVVFRSFSEGHNKKLVGLVVMLCTCMREVACSNLYGGTGHTGVLFRVFLSQFRQLLGQYLSTRRRPSNPFSIHHYPIDLPSTVCSLRHWNRSLRIIIIIIIIIIISGK